MGEKVENRVRKVLSVDFDYIMSPCINLYNSKVGGEANPTQLWNNLEHEMDIDKFLSYDAKALLSISRIMTKAVLEGARVVPIENHEDVVKHLKQLPDYEDISFNVINIDFHHDIIYHAEDAADIFDRDKCTCANWGMYLMAKDKIDRFTWVKAPGGTLPDPQVVANILGDEYFSQKINILSRKDIDKINLPFDDVFICLSPQWVPHKYHHLYDLLVNTLTSIMTMRNVEFDDNTNRHYHDASEKDMENSTTYDNHDEEDLSGEEVVDGVIDLLSPKKNYEDNDTDDVELSTIDERKPYGSRVTNLWGKLTHREDRGDVNET